MRQFNSGVGVLLFVCAGISAPASGRELSDVSKIIVEAANTQFQAIPTDAVPVIGAKCLRAELTDVRAGEADQLSRAAAAQEIPGLSEIERVISIARERELSRHIPQEDRETLERMGLTVVSGNTNDEIFANPKCTSVVRASAPVIVGDLAVSVIRYTPAGMSGAYSLPVVLKRYGSRWSVIAQVKGHLLLIHSK